MIDVYFKRLLVDTGAQDTILIQMYVVTLHHHITYTF